MAVVDDGAGATPPAPAPDGRTERSRRTRDAVLAALEALVRDGDADPGAKRIAERAGVSTRTVFAHFAGLEELHEALAQRAAVRVIGMLRPIDPAAPLPARIDDLVAQRGRANEEIGPLRRAAAVREGTSPALARARDRSRRASREQVARVFATELAPLDDVSRAGRAATLDALVSGETWDRLRTSHDLSVDEAGAALASAMASLLAPPAATGDDPASAASAPRSRTSMRRSHAWSPRSTRTATRSVRG